MSDTAEHVPDAEASQRPRTVGVLAAIDPDDRMSHVDAEVIRRQLEARLGPTVVILRTTLLSKRPLRHAAWTPTSPHHWTTQVDVVVVDERIDDSTRRSSGLAADIVVVTTSLWNDDTPLPALFASTTDAAALDTRDRMLDHLAVSHDDLADQHVAISATDLYLLARRRPDDLGDARFTALAAGQTPECDGLLREFDRIATDITSSELRDPPSNPADLIRQLDEERRNRVLDQHVAADRLDALQQQIDRLQDRVEAAELRSELSGATSPNEVATE